MLSSKQREEIYAEIMADSSIISASAAINHDVIDEVNILQATLLAMRLSIETVHKKILTTHFPESTTIDNCFALVDGNRSPTSLSMRSRSVIKGDSLCYCIALASIVAKVERDKMMVAFDQEYPQY